jgi:hypothetical protein
MSNARVHRALEEIGAPLLALAKRNISIRGPHETSKGRLVFFLEGSILTHEEIIELFEMGNLTARGIVDPKNSLKKIERPES